MLQAPSLIAVIDIGTNSARLEIAKLRSDGVVSIVGDEKISIRLGDSVFREGGIAGDAFDRALAAIKHLIKHAKAQDVERIRAVATSALREADNGRAFAERVENDTGVHIEIISGEEEARLIHLGACEDYPGSENVLVLDIGGGSTEVAVGRGADLWLTSVRAGSARLTEYFIHTDPPRPGELRTLETFLDNAFQSRWRELPQASVCLGTAGTNGAIADMLKREGMGFNGDGVSLLYEKLVRLDAEGRRRLLGPKEAGRTDIIIAGLAIAKSFFKVSGVKELKYSSRGLRDGLLVEEAVRAGLRPHELGDARTLRRNKLIQLGETYRFDRQHSEHVAAIAGKLFDGLAELHKLGDEKRDLLEAAALLHDIGHHISYTKHHKHTYYLIKNSDVAGFDENEVELIANIARYHRKAQPSEKHLPFKEMTKENRRVVQTLAAILRLADACDRRHTGGIGDVKIKSGNGAVTLRLYAPDSADVERWLIEERASELFESVFRKKIEVEVRSAKG
jgi:exopolyphosphatase/guanosine-5'-triphosphate,3'-diphosphate pyrophosphatase